MPAGRRSRFATAAVLSVAMVHVAVSKDLDPAKQRDEQKKVQARIEEASRRASSTIKAMLYQRLSAPAEQKMLGKLADSLKGLSQTEIKQIIDHLESAVQAPDPTRANGEQLKAYEKHRQVVAQLRGLLVELDVIKNLDEAAARFDRAADDQLAVNGETLLNVTRRGGRNPRGVGDAREELADKQLALGAEVGQVFKEIDRLLPNLNAEQKDRVEKAQVKSRGTTLTSEMTFTTRAVQQASFDDAAERQRRHAKELKDLAAALRTPPADKLAALKIARDKVDAALKAQEKVNEETAKKPDPADEKKPTAEAKREKANELANAQTKAEFATRDARKATEQAAPEVAEAIKPAETNQWKAEDKLRNADTDGAKEPQKKAAETLKAAKDDLDKQIAAAELARKDPLAAVKQAAEQIDTLIKDQKAAADKTDAADKNKDKLPEAAAAQKDVAKKADELKNTPLPPNPEAKAAIDKAADATKEAKADLDAKNPAAAKPDQKEAIKQLEMAKAALDSQAAKIEERRAEIAKLEEAKKDLDKLAIAEKKVADDAKQAATDPKMADPKAGDPKAGDPKAGDPKMGDPKMGDPKMSDPKAGDPKMGDPMTPDAKQPDTKALADKQGELQPPTKDVGEKLKDIAPDAAAKVAEAGMKQEGAKADLAKNDPKAGAEKANDAAKKLDEAAKAVDMQLAEKRGMEANEQAALMPNAADPMAAAQQLAKAVEQANKAADKADEAAKALAPQPMDGKPMAAAPKDGTPMADMPKGAMPPMDGMPNIGELQKQVAKQAADAKQPEAAKAADAAAKAIEKGDLPAAVENQQKALEALNKAAPAEPKDGTPMAGTPMAGMPKDGTPKDGTPKDGMPMEGTPKDGTPKDGTPMGGMPKDGMPMGGMGMPMGGMPPTPGELAKTQQKLLDATRALQQSQQATNAAKAALAQAQANAPMAVKPQLDMAQDALNMAGEKLDMGQPGEAGMNQTDAAMALQQALNALNAAAMANGQMPTQPGQNPMANAGMPPGMGMGMPPGMGKEPGMGMGKEPGMGMGKEPGMGMGKEPGMGEPMNEGTSEGDKDGPEKLKNSASSGKIQDGDGAFIHLRKRERDKVQQSAEAQFPAEFRELIKQYNINIKNNKPAVPVGGR